MSLLSLSGLTVLRGETAVLRDLSLTIGPGEFVGLIGPNGAGKTTLMRAALGLLAARGQSSLAVLPAADRARLAAFMPQARDIAWPVSVEALVALGRNGAGDARRDAAVVDAALARMGLGGLRHRRVSELSGGEQARVLIARALAQDTPLLLADEPIAGLDPAHQISAMQVFASLAAEGRGILASLHDLGLAARHCTRLVLLAGGRIHADGPPHAVLTPENLAAVFGVTGYFAETADGPVFQPLRVL
jgi:iron complex transport system ATP-binding protein